jgi:hypothetical protein
MSVLAQIPLSPPLQTRLIALLVVEVVLLLAAFLVWLKYDQLKHLSVDDWWERRQKSGLSPRVQRMIRESEEQYASEKRELDGGDETTGGQ